MDLLFWKKRKEVKHLLELLKSQEAWTITEEPVYLGNSKNMKWNIIDPRHIWKVFTLLDGDFKFWYGKFHKAMGNGFYDTVYHISFPESYSIKLNWAEERSLIKSIEKFFKRELDNKNKETSKLLSFIQALTK